jgi:hypothetical protein
MSDLTVYVIESNEGYGLSRVETLDHEEAVRIADRRAARYLISVPIIVEHAPTPAR